MNTHHPVISPRNPAKIARMRKILRKYIPPGILPRVKEAAEKDLDHIPNSAEVLTFLFADLVSFTSLAEQSTPDEVVHMLNLSIGATSSVIVYWGGIVNKFMGDSLFATFRDPMRAAIAAIEMQKQFQILNLMNMKDQSNEIRVRIGLHTGPCILASIGTDDYMDFTAIGDSVNVASRLEKACKPGAVLASMGTASAFSENIIASRPLTVEVKGKSEPIDACYIDRIRFHGPRGMVETGLDDELF